MVQTGRVHCKLISSLETIEEKPDWDFKKNKWPIINCYNLSINKYKLQIRIVLIWREGAPGAISEFLNWSSRAKKNAQGLLRFAFPDIHRCWIYKILVSYQAGWLWQFPSLYSNGHKNMPHLFSLKKGTIRVSSCWMKNWSPGFFWWKTEKNFQPKSVNLDF